MTPCLERAESEQLVVSPLHAGILCGWSDTSSSASPHAVRVLTMHVYGPANPDWDRRHRLMGDTIRALDPDVIALQEVPVDSMETLFSLVGTGYHFVHFSRPSEDGVAGTLATRWPHRVVQEIDLRISDRSRPFRLGDGG